MTSGSVAVADDDGILSSLRYLFADFLGDDDDTPPFLPEALPERLSPVVSDAIHLLIDYQSAGYARLYVDRLRRFIGRRGVSEAMLGDIARLMAERMAYQDPIRIAQLKLAGLDEAGAQAGSAEVIKFRLDELVEALPAVIAEPVLDALEWVGWVRKSRMSIRVLDPHPLWHPPPEDRGRTAAVAAVLGALCQGAGLGRALAAYDRSQPDQAAAGGIGDRRDRDHDQGPWRGLPPGAC